MRLTLTIGAPGMSAANDFFVLLAPGMKAAFTQAASDTLDIVKWQSITPAPTGTIADTISAGVKYAWVLIPNDDYSEQFFSGLSMKSTSPELVVRYHPNDRERRPRGDHRLYHLEALKTSTVEHQIGECVRAIR